MKKEELETILKLHAKWLNSEPDGKKAELWDADLLMQIALTTTVGMSARMEFISS